MTNRQYLIGEIKKTLDRADLSTRDRGKLIAIMSKLVPAPAPKTEPDKPKKPAAPKSTPGPFERPSRPEFLGQ